MVLKKEIEGEEKPKDLWNEQLVAPIPMDQFARETAETEKLLLCGFSNTGKTRWYLKILDNLKKRGIPKEKIMMCIVFPDRGTGLTKLYNLIPKEFVKNVFVFPINNYEELVSSTAVAEKKLTQHFKETGVHGWLVIELLEECWRFSQDYYSRQAFGETLADYLALQRESVKERMKQVSKKQGKEVEDTAFQALEGWKDWTIIKFFHNFNWIDRIKKMPFNVLFTAEVRAEDDKDSPFASIGNRPAGEKDNIHRVDTVLYLKHTGDNFSQQCMKLTGYDRLYSAYDITSKNGYEEHCRILKMFEDKGYKSSAIEELEKEAGIPIPLNESKKEPEKTIQTISKTPTGETTTQVSKEELVKKEEKKSDVDWEVSL